MNPKTKTYFRTVAGLRFFPVFLTDARRMALDESALAWQALGRREYQALKGGRAAVPPLLETTKARLPFPGNFGTGSDYGSFYFQHAFFLPCLLPMCEALVCEALMDEALMCEALYRSRANE
jgi:hypothetical protein